LLIVQTKYVINLYPNLMSTYFCKSFVTVIIIRGFILISCSRVEQLLNGMSNTYFLMSSFFVLFSNSKYNYLHRIKMVTKVMSNKWLM